MSSEAEYLKSISSSLRFRDKEWQRIDGKKGRGKEGAEEEEGHFPHRRYHCTWERDGGTAKGERKQSRKLKSSDEMWERERERGEGGRGSCCCRRTGKKSRLLAEENESTDQDEMGLYQPWEEGMGASQDVEDGPLLPGLGNTE